MIKKELTFNNFLDFYNSKENIKEIYDTLTLEEKQIYKMYVYSLCFEDDYNKDLIWEYLNDWEENKFDLGKVYREKKTKLEKRKKTQIKDEEDCEIYH